MQIERGGLLLIYHNLCCIDDSLEFATYTYLAALYLDTMRVEKRDPMYDLLFQLNSGRIYLVVVFLP